MRSMESTKKKNGDKGIFPISPFL